MTLSNPWDNLKLEPLSPEQEARVGELLGTTIIDPPFHGEAVGWDVDLEDWEVQ